MAGHRNPKEKTRKTLKIGLIKIHVNKVIKASPIYSSALSEQCCSDTPAAPTGAFDAPRSPYSGEQTSPGTQWPLKVGTFSLRKPFEPSEPTPRLGMTFPSAILCPSVSGLWDLGENLVLGRWLSGQNPFPHKQKHQHPHKRWAALCNTGTQESDKVLGQGG